MSAKKTAKKKLTPRSEANKRYRANKQARELAALVDAVIQPGPKPPVYGDADDFNEFAPNMGMGEDPVDQETGEFVEDKEEVFPESWIGVERVDQESAQQEVVAALSLPSPAPVTASLAAFDQLIANAPAEPEKSPMLPDTLEPPSDALVVERLINGINHLYGFAKTIKGIRGPQPDHIARIQTNLVQARALLARLK